ncbi:MAG TPA: hypothetical protein VHQ22_19730 [Terriglobales bacterium]|nr:hypothetical protein [Terriglobales bacterium]
MSPKRRATAVIAVHGVGDQKPFETARKIGDLLQELATKPRNSSQKPPSCADPEPEEPRYFPFREQGLRMNVNPVVMHKETAKDPAATESAMTADQRRARLNGERAIRGPFDTLVQKQMRDEKRKQAEEKAKKKKLKQAKNDQEKNNGGRPEETTRKVTKECPRPQFDLHTEFMKGQLRCYGGDDPEDTYETIRIEGERASEKESEPQHDVHIYELYWADLSRLKAGIFSIFTELYQLLFHLSSLGTHTVNSAVLQHLDNWRWRWFKNFQSWSTLTLVVVIPILNILMLGIVAVVFGLGILKGAGEKFHDAGVAFIAVVCGALVAIGLGIQLWRNMDSTGLKPGFIRWILPLLLGLATSTALLRVPYLSAHIGGHPVGIETLILAVLSGLACLAILAQYNKRRPGLWNWTIIIAALVAVVAAVSWVCNSGADPCVGYGVWWKNINQVVLRVFESACGVLSIAWGALFVLVILTWITGLLAAGINPRRRDKKDPRSRWTGFLLLSLPTLTFSAVTILGWGLIAKGIVNYLPSVKYTSFLPGVNAISGAQLADALLKIPYTWMLPLVLAAMGMAALPAIWSLLPIVFAEVVPPPSDLALTPNISKRLGNWLSMAFRCGLLISGYILFAVSTFLLPVVVCAGVYLAIKDPDAFTKYAALQSLGVLSGAIFTWVFLARGSLKKLALGFRPALDLLLDVDNWFREHPLNKNPKARICGRYISLLRYIANWKSVDHPDGYEKIVIIAHSQGTVISADLLRFLHSDNGLGKSWIELDPQLKKIKDKSLPISLFTMGCPLRQLYGARFPYLYGWAAHEVDKTMPEWAENDLRFTKEEDTSTPGPDPERLGLKLWVNAFRSGDYVGRHLWRTDVCEYLWEPDKVGYPVEGPKKSVSTDGRKRVEFCIGAGAHTHYWDVTAPMIAEEADRLIR